MPPLRRFPEAVQQVRVWQRGPFMYLEWNAPSRNTDGSAELELEEALVLRRVVAIPPEPEEAGVLDSAGADQTRVEEEADLENVSPVEQEVSDASPPAEGGPPGEEETVDTSEARDEPGAGVGGGEPASQPDVPPPFPAGAEEIATLESTQAGELLVFRDPWDPAWEGKRVEYGVRHINRKGRRSGLSLIVHLDPLPPFGPPEGLTAQVEAERVRLRWSSGETVSVEKEGTVSFGYNVYRRGETELFPASPLNAQPIVEGSYEDSTVVFGQPWCYAVRRVVVSEPREVESAHPVIESLDSEEMCLTPVDTFPPTTPENVVAVTSSEGVLLSWSIVTTPDVKGYLVYRATEREGPFELLNREPVAAASYTDGNVESGAVYFYAVSAVDRVEPWNESPRSRPVSIRVPENP